MNKSQQSKILVTGATGNVGRSVVTQLAATGSRVRALTRNPDAANLPDEVEVTGGDFSLPASLDGCLDGIETVFLIWRSLPSSAIPALVDTVAKHARRVVFLSSSAVRDELKTQADPIGQIHIEVEERIKESGLEWTFLRPGAFATNTLAWWAPQIRAGDVVRWPFGSAAWAPIHERDIAAVAVRALTEDGHSGVKYFLTGSESLTQMEQLRAIGETIDRPLRFEELPPEAAWRQMSALMPPIIADRLLELWAGMVTEPAPTTATVEQVTGAPARTFREWAMDHARDFQSSPEIA
jgi:uncharacterized protein YbjT (DUF2867 family)